MSIVPVLIVTIVVAIAALTVLAMGTEKRKIAQQMNVAVSASVAKEKLKGLVLAPQSWKATQDGNPTAFGALNPDNPPALNLYTPGGTQPYYQVTNERTGFDLQGKVCSDFSANGSDACPLRYDVRLISSDTVRFNLLFRPATSRLQLNANEFSFTVQRNVDPQSVEAGCLILSGTYNADTRTCSKKLTVQSSACSTGSTFRGPASSGSNSDCGQLVNQSVNCTGTDRVMGFDNQRGTPVCGAPL